MILFLQKVGAGITFGETKWTKKKFVFA